VLCEIDGANVTPIANNLHILSQQENHSLQSSNKNASGGVGIQIGSDGVGFYAQASVGKGSAHGNGTTHAESLVNANDTLTLVSGNDTTIKGAQLTGNTVIAAIGNNLLIQSEQDTDDYASKQQQLGGKMVIGYGSGGSLSYNQSKVNSHYASVNEVSGIQAGSGGFDITVGGNTHLMGGVIASTADPSKNLLDSGSLTYESIHNEANYSASSIGVSAGYGSGGFSASPMLGVPQKGNSSSDTSSGIAQGTIIQRDGSTDLAGLDRNPTLDHQTLNPIFDAQKVQENMELGQLAGQVGMRTAGSVADYMYTQAAANGDKAGMAAWNDGGINNTILHGLVGAATAALGGGDALQGGLGAAASEAASKAMGQWLYDTYKIDPNSPEGKTFMALASAAIGGAVGGGSGTDTALQGELYNRQLHPNEIKLITGELAAKYVADHPGMSEQDAETILIKQTLRQVDDAWAAKLGPDDQDAQQWLTANMPDWAKQQGYFTATAAERADATINGQYYDEAFHNHLTWDSLLTDVQGSFGGDDRTPAQHGSLVNLDGYADVANQLRDQGTLESLQRKVASGQMLTDEEVNTYAKLATLYPMLKAGALGPAGQLGLGIRDGDSGAVAAAILGGIPGESAAAAAGKAADATADALKANVLKNIAESQAAREASNFAIHSAVSDQINWGYASDNWSMVTLPKGTILYGGLPGQSAYYTDISALTNAGYDSATLFQSLQVRPHDVFGYRPEMGAYILNSDVRIPAGTVQANPGFGSGGANQYFIQQYQKYLELKDRIPLRK